MVTLTEFAALMILVAYHLSQQHRLKLRPQI